MYPLLNEFYELNEFYCSRYEAGIFIVKFSRPTSKGNCGLKYRGCWNSSPGMRETNDKLSESS